MALKCLFAAHPQWGEAQDAWDRATGLISKRQALLIGAQCV